MPEVGFDKEVGTPGSDPEEWLGEVQSTWLSYEHNPFTRSPFFNEATPPLIASVLLSCVPLQAVKTTAGLFFVPAFSIFITNPVNIVLIRERPC